MSPCPLLAPCSFAIRSCLWQAPLLCLACRWKTSLSVFYTRSPSAWIELFALEFPFDLVIIPDNMLASKTLGPDSVYGTCSLPQLSPSRFQHPLFLWHHRHSPPRQKEESTEVWNWALAAFSGPSLNFSTFFANEPVSKQWSLESRVEKGKWRYSLEALAHAAWHHWSNFQSSK